MNRQGLEKLSEVRDAIWKLQQILDDKRLFRGGGGGLWSRNPLGYLYTNIAGDVLGMGDGAAGAPIYSFLADFDTGMYRVGANQLGFAAQGVQIAGIYNDAIADQILLVDGDNANPAYSFLHDRDTGMYLAALNDVRIAAGGVDGISVTATDVNSVLVHRFIDGLVGAPGMTFFTDPDTGIYRIGINSFGFTAGGVLIAMIAANGLTLLLGTNINEFSTDGTMAGNSDDAVPTERAVVTYTAPLRLYDATVAPAGGDYVDIQSAITAGATSIFVRSGIYVVGADIVLPDGAVIVGEDKDKTILDFNNAAFQMHASGAAGAGNEFSNIRIENITFTQSEDTNGALYFFHVTNSLIRNCVFDSNGDRGLYVLNSDNILVTGNYFTGHSGDYAYHLSGGHDTTYQIGCQIIANRFYYNKYNCYVFLAHYSIIANNHFLRNTGSYNLRLNSAYCSITGNVFYRGSPGIRLESGADYNQITGNNFSFWQAFGIAIIAGALYNVISGNEFYYMSTSGIVSYSDYTLITGNNFEECGNGVQLITDADSNVISGNFFRNTTTPINIGAGCDNNRIINNFIEWKAGTTVDILDNGTTNEIVGDQGINDVTVKEYRLMQNTSGGALVAGDVVTFKAVAAGNEFTTTVNQGDDLVWGMLAENIADTAWGKVQVLGYTTLLKVDGTIDIAIGDFIGTFTAAGIGMKAAAGDMAIAIALEAYTNDDSNGVIDALIITQRKI